VKKVTVRESGRNQILPERYRCPMFTWNVTTSHKWLNVPWMRRTNITGSATGLRATFFLAGRLLYIVPGKCMLISISDESNKRVQDTQRAWIILGQTML
jgi:hypothetical protein